MMSTQDTTPVSFSYDSGHGYYDALPVRDSDAAPEFATHTVFREDGSLAGFAALCGWAWGAEEDARHGRKLLPTLFCNLYGAVQSVAEEDQEPE